MSRSPPASAIGRISPNIVEGYQTLGRAGAVTGLLGVKMNELIALAVALAVRCDDCIAVHTAAAIRAGTTHEEIAEIFSDAAAHAMARMIENVPAPGGNAAKPHSMMAMSPGMMAASYMSNGAGTGIPGWPMPGSSTTGMGAMRLVNLSQSLEISGMCQRPAAGSALPCCCRNIRRAARSQRQWREGTTMR